jgi:hypothetical protein
MSRFNKGEIQREIERDRRARVKSRLAELVKLIREAQAARRDAIKGVRVQCRVAREKLRTTCHARAERARVEGAAEIAERRKALKGERHAENMIRDADRRGMKRTGPRSTSKERRQESDDEVRANLDDEMVAVFDAVKRHIKAGPRRTRTEAFLEWVHDNPDEVWAIRNVQTDRDVKRLIAEQRELERLSRKRRLAASEVPF